MSKLYSKKNYELHEFYGKIISYTRQKTLCALWSLSLCGKKIRYLLQILLN